MKEYSVHIFSNELVEKTIKWLGEDGLNYFRKWMDEFGEDWYFSCKNIDGIPYSIHFHDGMQVRNFIRMSNLCDNIDCHFLDDNWHFLIEQCVGRLKC